MLLWIVPCGVGDRVDVLQRISFDKQQARERFHGTQLARIGLRFPDSASGSLDYESKIDCSAAHIQHLIIEGEQCARAFLHQGTRLVAAEPLVTTSR
jgi:hypothetical protein